MDFIIKLFLLFIIYSFVGWIMEVLVVLHDTKKLVNRGFLVGPLLPIYGSGSVLMALLLSGYKDEPVALFCMAVFICSLLEYFTSYFMEKIFKLRWWDYSDKKFHINGRVCLDNAFAFGVLGLLMVEFINPFVISVIDSIPIIIIRIVVGILFVLFITDLIVSFKVINGFSKVAKSVKKDNTEEITKKVREYFVKKGGLYERLTEAFNFEASERLLKDVATKVTTTVKKAGETAKETIDIHAKKLEGAAKKIEEEYNKKIKKLEEEKNKKIEKINKK